MKRFHLLACIGAAGLWAALTPTASVAQQVTHGGTEISVMHGFVVATSNGGDGLATIIMTPVPPVWRVTFWTHSRLIIESGFSLLSATSEGYNVTVMNLEGGAGANLAPRNNRLVPFVSGVGGILLLSTSEDESKIYPYLGAQIGNRTFLRDFAALRFQVGFRHVFVEDGDGANLIEVVGGLSFFL